RAEEKANRPTWQEMQAEERRHHAETVRMATVAARYLAPAMPENTDLLIELFDIITERIYMEGYKPDHDGFNQGKRPVKQECVALVILLGHYWLNDNHNRKNTDLFIQWVDKFAGALGVRLPEGWAAPPVSDGQAEPNSPKTKLAKSKKVAQ
ncbi:MAG: hypothetical protein M1546_24615, partial [Chloroflexi bacterium]|nr:hypothetical protein [Chloroflexota bacterium]